MKEIDWISDSNASHCFLHYSFDCNCHHPFDEDYCNYSNVVVVRNIDCVIDQIDDESDVRVNDPLNNALEQFHSQEYLSSMHCQFDVDHRDYDDRTKLKMKWKY